MNKRGLPITLGTEKIGKLLIQYALPAIIAMTASALYNITDSIFIGHGVGALAIAGLSITFPLMNLAAAFGSLVGAGAATLMSLRLGQKDYNTANHILGNVVMLNLILGIAYTIAIFIFLDPILYFFGASDATIQYARDYMVVILLGNVVTHMYLGLNALLRSIGKPKIAMMTTIFSVIINVILTPLFIFVFDWGIQGAAVATIIAQVLMLIWQFRLFSNKNEFIHLQKGIFGLKRKIVKDSLSIGMSPFLMNAVMSLIVVLINRGLVRYGGDLAVGAYGIVNRVSALFLMIVFGLTQGMQPIAGYNFGAGLHNRVSQTLKITIFMATGVMVAGFLVSQFLPRTIASAFTSDQHLIEMSVPALRIVMFFFPIIGFQMVTSIFFQSIGLVGKAIFMSMARQVLFLIPLLLILPTYYGVNGIWYSMPISDLVSSLIAAYLLVGHFRKYRNKA